MIKNLIYVCGVFSIVCTFVFSGFQCDTKPQTYPEDAIVPQEYFNVDSITDTLTKKIKYKDSQIILKDLEIEMLKEKLAEKVPVVYNEFAPDTINFDYYDSLLLNK